MYFTTRMDAKTGRKFLVIDTTVIPTPAEQSAAQLYVNAGYEIRFKSEKRAAAARKRIKENGGKIGKKKEEAAE